MSRGNMHWLKPTEIWLDFSQRTQHTPQEVQQVKARYKGTVTGLEMQPVVVREAPEPHGTGRYQLLNGEFAWFIALMTNIAEVPATVVVVSDADLPSFLVRLNQPARLDWE